MNTSVSDISVDLLTEISLAALLKVVIAPMETHVLKKHLLLCTQTYVTVNLMAEIVGPLIRNRFSMTNEVIRELNK